MFCSTCNFDLRGLTTSICPECGHAFSPADPSTYLAKPTSPLYPVFRRAVYTLVALVLCGIVATIGLVIVSARRAMDAEYRYQVPTLVCDLIVEYVEKSPTHSWPTSWKDLESLPPRDLIYAWPRDADKVRQYVTIDFTLTTADVLKQTPQTCTAIKSTPGPSYGTPPSLYDFFDRLQAAAATPAPVPPIPPRE